MEELKYFLVILVILLLSLAANCSPRNKNKLGGSANRPIMFILKYLVLLYQYLFTVDDVQSFGWSVYFATL